MVCLSVGIYLPRSYDSLTQAWKPRSNSPTTYRRFQLSFSKSCVSSQFCPIKWCKKSFYSFDQTYARTILFIWHNPILSGRYISSNIPRTILQVQLYYITMQQKKYILCCFIPIQIGLSHGFRYSHPYYEWGFSDT